MVPKDAGAQTLNQQTRRATREAYEMNVMEFERHSIRQRNDELLREVRMLRLEGRLRAGHRGGALRTAVAAIRRLQPAS